MVAQQTNIRDINTANEGKQRADSLEDVEVEAD